MERNLGNFDFTLLDQQKYLAAGTIVQQASVSSGRDSDVVIQSSSCYGGALPKSSLSPFRPVVLAHAASVPATTALAGSSLTPAERCKVQFGSGEVDRSSDIRPGASTWQPFGRAIALTDIGVRRPIEEIALPQTFGVTCASLPERMEPASAESGTPLVQGQRQDTKIEQQAVVYKHIHEQLNNPERSTQNPVALSSNEEIRGGAVAQEFGEEGRLALSAVSQARTEESQMADPQLAVASTADQHLKMHVSRTLEMQNLEGSSFAKVDESEACAQEVAGNTFAKDLDLSEGDQHSDKEPQSAVESMAIHELSDEACAAVGSERHEDSSVLPQLREEIRLQPAVNKLLIEDEDTGTRHAEKVLLEPQTLVEFSLIDNEYSSMKHAEKELDPQTLDVEVPTLAETSTGHDAVPQNMEILPHRTKYMWMALFVGASSVVAGIWAPSVALDFVPGEMVLGGILGFSEIGLAAALYAICRPGLNVCILRLSVAVMGIVLALLYGWFVNLQLPWPRAMNFVFPLTLGISKYLALPVLFCFRAAPLPSTCPRTRLQALPVNVLAGLAAITDVVVDIILKQSFIAFLTNAGVILFVAGFMQLRKRSWWKDPEGFHLGYAILLVWAHNVPRFLLTFAFSIGDLAADIADGQEELIGLLDSGVIYCVQGMVMILSFLWEMAAAQVCPRGTTLEFEVTDALPLTFGLKLTVPMILQGLVLKAPAMGGTYFIVIACTFLMNVGLMSGALPMLLFKLEPRLTRLIRLLKVFCFCWKKDIQSSGSESVQRPADKFIYVCVRHLRTQAVQLLAQATAFTVCLVTVGSECLVFALLDRPECCELLDVNSTVTRETCLGRDEQYVVKDIKKASCPRFTARHTHDSRLLLLANYAIQAVMFITCALLASRIFRFLASKLKRGVDMSADDEKRWESFVNIENAAQHLLRFRFFITAVAVQLIPYVLNTITRNTYGKNPF